MERAAHVGLIEQALKFPPMNEEGSKAHRTVMRWLVNPAKKRFYELKLATVDEALRYLRDSNTAVNKKTFIAAVNKIKSRDSIVESAAQACVIDLGTIDRKELNAAIDVFTIDPGLPPKDRERHIQGMLIKHDLVARMEKAELPTDELDDLMFELFDTKGGLRHEVNLVTAHLILGKLVDAHEVDAREEVTVTRFSDLLARWQAHRLKPAQKVEAARVWVKYEVEAVAKESAGGTIQGEDAPGPFMGEAEGMGMPAQSGRAAFYEACNDHFKGPVQKALSIVTQGPETVEKFSDAMVELLKIDNIQALAVILRSARSEIGGAPAAQALRDAFDWSILKVIVIPLIEAMAEASSLTEAQLETVGDFRALLLTVADRPIAADEQSLSGVAKKLIFDSQVAYKDFVNRVVTRGGFESELRKLWLADRSQAIINEAVKDPELEYLPLETMADRIRAAVMGLPPGSSPEDMEHAARGALIELDVLDRVMKVRQKARANWIEPVKGYDDQELERFKEVARSLFNPLGEYRDVDLATAQRVLRSLADLGQEIRMEDFINAMWADEAMRSSLQQKEASVRLWMRHHVGAKGQEGLSQIDVHEFLVTDSTVPGNVDIPGRAALRSVAEKLRFGQLVQQALQMLQWDSKFDPTSLNEGGIKETARKFDAVMALLLQDSPAEPNPDKVSDKKPDMKRAVAEMPQDFCKLYAVASSELKKARFAPGLDSDKQMMLLQSKFDTSIFLRTLKPLFDEAIKKDSSNLRGWGVDSFVQLLEQVCSEEDASEQKYPAPIKAALDVWRAQYRTFMGKVAARSISEVMPARVV